MANWRIEIKVFLGSPDRIVAWRRRAIDTIKAITSDGLIRHVRYLPFDYGDVPGGVGHAEELILQGLRSSDSAALIFDQETSVATEQEYTTAIEEHYAGRLPNVTVYFGPSTDGKETNTPFRRTVGGQVLYRKFANEDDLVEAIRKDWTVRARALDAAAECLLRADLPTKELMTVTMVFTPPMQDGVYKLSKQPSEKIISLGKSAQTKHLAGKDLEPVEMYALAQLLDASIAAKNFEPMILKPFPNKVHQYLSKRIRLDLDLPDRAQRIETLKKWLGDVGSIPPTVRDFAAFELGMCKAVTAVNDLRKAMLRPNETLAVRRYAALALGMIRHIDSIEPLVKCHLDTDEPAELRDFTLRALAGILSAADDPSLY